MKGILGQKAGMTQVFSNDGALTPVTVIDITGNIVTQVKTTATDGYNSIQLSIGEQKAQRAGKPKVGHYAKAKTTPKRFTKEIREMSGFELGALVKGTDLFTPGEFVDVTGISKGKGFAGVIKRHNQSIGPKSHGSQFHRQMGSMGDIEGNKISKGKGMAGQMGNVRRTTQNLEVVSINDDEGYMLIKGSVPGPNKSYIMVRSAVKLKAAKDALNLVDYKAEKEAAAKVVAEAKAAKVAAAEVKVTEPAEPVIKETKEAPAVEVTTETPIPTAEAKKG